MFCSRSSKLNKGSGKLFFYTLRNCQKKQTIVLVLLSSLWIGSVDAFCGRCFGIIESLLSLFTVQARLTAPCHWSYFSCSWTGTQRKVMENLIFFTLCGTLCGTHKATACSVHGKTLHPKLKRAGWVSGHLMVVKVDCPLWVFGQSVWSGGVHILFMSDGRMMQEMDRRTRASSKVT